MVVLFLFRRVRLGIIRHNENLLDVIIVYRSDYAQALFSLRLFLLNRIFE